MRSAARPEPSQTTTGTGGVSVTYSKTALIVFVPPSITKQTTGVLECVTRLKVKHKPRNYFQTFIITGHKCLLCGKKEQLIDRM